MLERTRCTSSAVVSALVPLAAFAALFALRPLAASPAAEAPKAAPKKIVLLAGGPSHGYGGHDHKAGCHLLAKALRESVAGVDAVVVEGWPKDPAVLEGASCIVLFSDGQGGHVARGKFAELDALAAKGAGIVLLHYAVEPERNEEGAKHFLRWTGGFYEKRWSVNPHWRAKFERLPGHPIARGVKPFEIDDEWYFNMRFAEDMKGVTPILTAVPPDEVRNRPDDDHGGNPFVRSQKGRPEHVAWAYERPGGGRGFGFTGGHWHHNWAHPDFRKVVLNAIVWCAGMEVPEGGVRSKNPTIEDLRANHDEAEPRNFDWKRIRKETEAWPKE